MEKWVFQNNSGGWQHPIHMHFEEFQTLTINGNAPSSTGLITRGRKDVFRLEHNMEAKVYFRFRDFVGRIPAALSQRGPRRPRHDGARA